MKTIEAPLTAILIVLCLGFITKHHMDKIKKEKEDAKAAIELQKAKEELARLEAERAERTISYTVEHDSDPDTKTHIVTVTATGNDEDNDDFTWEWEQTEGSKVDFDTDTSQITFEAESGQYKFVLTLTDVYGSSCSEYVIVDIAPEPNECPVPSINYSNTPILIESDTSVVLSE
tara:strand:- start:389 stop:913 length:525 start_codon:yes stop_codon:yes gene_type:complete